MNKLQSVGSELERVELRKQNLSNSATTNLERTIAANKLIIDALSKVITELENKELQPMLITRFEELLETIGEQKLSLQLLRLLEITGGDKAAASQWLKEKLDFNERNF